jgi:tetratricopeptide (TPR) repeat protein
MFRAWAALVVILMMAGIAVSAPPAAKKLAVTPLEAFEKVAELDGRTPAVAKDEVALFEDAKDGKFGRFSFADACLIASGVTDPRVRKKYVDRLDEIEVRAREATAGTKSVREDGERLLKFLHAGPMAKGFNPDQTDLHGLLDTGSFNCVSSAALYTVMGQRLGIDIRAVEVPEHVFSVLVTKDGIVDVETTSPLGFDVDPKRPFGEAKVARPLTQRREVAPSGLAAVVAFNRGVTLGDQKKYIESVRAYLFALGLDPNNHNAVNNVLGTLANWTAELARGKKYEKAMAVISVARVFSPNEPRLILRTEALFDTWATEFVNLQDWAGAAQIYDRGLRELPDSKHLKYNLSICQSNMR